MEKLWMAPHGLHIEPAESQDAQRLAKLHEQGFFRGWPVADFTAFIADRNTPAYIACDAKRRITGFALIRLVADESELLTIAVDPKWRGKGVGNALLKAVFADLMLSPAKKMFLEVDAENTPAVKLYERLGFTTISARKGYYPRPDGTAATALVMSRDLG